MKEVLQPTNFTAGDLKLNAVCISFVFVLYVTINSHCWVYITSQNCMLHFFLVHSLIALNGISNKVLFHSNPSGRKHNEGGILWHVYVFCLPGKMFLIPKVDLGPVVGQREDWSGLLTLLPQHPPLE